jgi:RHS repeat-associated protein
VQAWAYGAHSYRREHDQNGRIESHTRGSSTRSLGFDLASRIVELEDADAAQAWSFDYDDADRLTDANNAANTGATAQLTLGWTFDATGNRNQQTRQIGAASPQLTDYSTEPTSNRLSSLSIDGQARARSFDAVGNTTAWTAEAGDFAGSRMRASYGGRNRLQSVSREDAGGPVRIARYAYNAFGERIAKWTGAAAIANTGAPSRQYVYDDEGRLIGEYSGSGELISEHVWLDDTPVAVLKPATSPQGGQAIAANGSAPALRAYFVHPDHLDTPRVIVNAANQTVWRWDSAPYGDTAADENPNGLGEFSYSLRLPGQQYDGESGQHYNYFRDYEAATGRYVQSDPIGLWGGLDNYSYTNGPVTSTDPFGLSKKPRVNHEGDGVIPPGCSIRSLLYPVRPRQGTIQRIGVPDKCVICGESFGSSKPPTFRHGDPLVQYHNSRGYNASQQERNDAFNELIDGYDCDPCQKKQGGQMQDRYRRDTGPDFKPRNSK